MKISNRIAQRWKCVFSANMVERIRALHILWRCYNLCSFYAQSDVNFDKMIWLLEFIFPLVNDCFFANVNRSSITSAISYTWHDVEYIQWIRLLLVLFFVSICLSRLQFSSAHIVCFDNIFSGAFFSFCIHSLVIALKAL